MLKCALGPRYDCEMRLGWLVTVGLASAMAACSGGDGAPTCTGSGCACTGGECTCAAGTDCKTTCGDGPCRVDCSSAAMCEADTTDKLNLSCNDSSACKGTGGDDSILACNGSSTCDFKLGTSADVTCASTATCTLELDGGSVICLDNSSCTVTCNGDCRVSCSGTAAACALTCGSSGAAANMCSASIFACGPC